MSNSVVNASIQVKNFQVEGLDKHLTENPQTSIFSYGYRTHTPWAKNTMALNFNERVDFGRTITATVPFLGDLLHNVLFYVRLPPLPLPLQSNYIGWTQSVGYAMIDYVELRINDVAIDRQTGLFMEIMDSLTTSNDKATARNRCVGRYDNPNVLTQNATGYQDLYIPLQLWFTKEIPSALPLISLSLAGQSVKIVIKLKPFKDLITFDGPIEPVAQTMMEAQLIVDYYHLGKDERLFYYAPQHYLIEQWQWSSFPITAGTTTNKFSLNFSNCVKEIVWVIRETESENNNDHFNFGRRNIMDGNQVVSTNLQGGALISNVTLNFEGRERFEKLRESYYSQVTVQYTHTYGSDRNIYVLPFAKNPEMNQPTGMVNFSKYDDIDLVLDFVDNVPSCELHVLGICYNKLSISKEKGVIVEYIS